MTFARNCLIVGILAFASHFSAASDCLVKNFYAQTVGYIDQTGAIYSIGNNEEKQIGYVTFGGEVYQTSDSSADRRIGYINLKGQSVWLSSSGQQITMGYVNEHGEIIPLADESRTVGTISGCNNETLRSSASALSLILSNSFVAFRVLETGEDAEKAIQNAKTKIANDVQSKCKQKGFSGNSVARKHPSCFNIPYSETEVGAICTASFFCT